MKLFVDTIVTCMIMVVLITKQIYQRSKKCTTIKEIDLENSEQSQIIN